MSAKEDKMAREVAERVQPIRDKINELDRQIEELSRRLSEAMASKKVLMEVLATMTGEASTTLVTTDRKRRATNVKGVVLDIMLAAGSVGRTSAEVVVEAGEKIPGIARDTVSSVLSRLKGAGALVYDGLRYYEAKHGPKDSEAFTPVPHIRAV